MAQKIGSKYNHISCKHGFILIRVMLLQALWANTMAYISKEMLLDIHINLFPIPIIISNLLAIRTKWQNAPQILNLIQGITELDNQFLTFIFYLLQMCQIIKGKE